MMMRDRLTQLRADHAALAMRAVSMPARSRGRTIALHNLTHLMSEILRAEMETTTETNPTPNAETIRRPIAMGLLASEMRAASLELVWAFDGDRAHDVILNKARIVCAVADQIKQEIERK
jgi:hypothetical protein